jgi:hypothetical protein
VSDVDAVVLVVIVPDVLDDDDGVAIGVVATPPPPHALMADASTKPKREKRKTEKRYPPSIARLFCDDSRLSWRPSLRESDPLRRLRH